jgi:hypothetical protein
MSPGHGTIPPAGSVPAECRPNGPLNGQPLHSLSLFFRLASMTNPSALLRRHDETTRLLTGEDR